MNVRTLFFLSFAFSTGLITAAEPSHKLADAPELPEGVSQEVAETLAPQGHRIVGPEGPVAEIWIVKELAVKEGFRPTLTVKYPFTPGSLVGLLHVPEGADFTDFRGQEFSSGTYTLRYGQQPEDGNHIGTSELYDFLLAVPAKEDTDPKPIPNAMQLHRDSAKSVGSTHPAIFSLVPAEKAVDKSALAHDSNEDFWILETTVTGKSGDDAKPLPIRLIVIGISEG